jgi:hypothetical protein
MNLYVIDIIRRFWSSNPIYTLSKEGKKLKWNTKFAGKNIW